MSHKCIEAEIIKISAKLNYMFGDSIILKHPCLQSLAING